MLLLPRFHKSLKGKKGGNWFQRSDETGDMTSLTSRESPSLPKGTGGGEAIKEEVEEEQEVVEEERKEVEEERRRRLPG